MTPKGIKNRIALIGVELEGGWDKVLPKGHAVIRDGSVKFGKNRDIPGTGNRGALDDGGVGIFDRPLTARQRAAAGIPPEGIAPDPARVVIPDMVIPYWIGEIPSPPLETAPEVWRAWMKLCYPKYVNETCGLHVHQSFRHRLNYMRLMTPDYTKVMVKKLLEFAEEKRLPKDHRIWERLTNPDHRHCAHTYLGDAQAKRKGKDFNSRGTPHSRYTAVNYAYAAHKTVEVRLLPMFDNVDDAIEAVDRVCLITNEFLAKVKAKEPRVEAKVAIGTGIRDVHTARL